jgi:Uma2 family endonuclease
MATRAADVRMSLAEFLDWDDGTDRRYQLVDGMPVMMAPATEAHGEVAASLGAEIRDRPAGSSMRPASRFPAVATPITSPTRP